MSKKKSKQLYNPPISMFNWFITLLISIIPGANILFFIFGISFAKSPTKRSYCIAALILTILLISFAAIMLFFFSDTLVSWAKGILSAAEPASV